MASHCLFGLEDMIFEILSRLPVKSLVRFMAISKSYSFMISSPQFIRAHTLQSPSKILIAFRQNITQYGRHKEFYTLHAKHQLALCREIRFEYPFRDFHIIYSCNGILFLENYNHGVEEFMCLWNPSLRCKLTLPRINPSMRVSGFGYDDITDDYKVLRMSSDLDDPMVYSMKKGAWVAIPPPTNHYARINSYFSCFVNGAMHWVVSNLQGDSIMTFDISAHLFGEIALPDEIKDCRYFKLIMIRESLGVVARFMNEFGVWIMGEYKNASTWSRVYKINCQHWKTELRWCFEANGEIFMLFRTINDPGFQIFNAVTGARSKLVELGVDNIILDEVQTFKETLCLLNGGLRY